MKRIVGIIILSFVSGVTGAWFYGKYIVKKAPQAQSVRLNDISTEADQATFADNSGSIRIPNNDGDFVNASRISTKSVVYIRNISERYNRMSFMDYFFGVEPSSEYRVSSGSGVIFTQDGYIVSNNHVIEDADRIEVIYDKQKYNATLIGRDPSSDLAVLKIEASNLPSIPLGTSKDVKVGEWVIAVGNPFNLTSTVTAGIVSAKGRQINILKDKFPIESFIQTDAAINPGNSGGALVNREGSLIGINTAILSRTGSYTGYGFAVPIDIVRKIFQDLVKYGEVQKAFFGGDVEDFNAELARNLDVKTDGNFDGVLLTYLQKTGAAREAGMEEGDIIIKIDDLEVKSRSNFEEELSYRSPGDKIKVAYRRGSKISEAMLTLTNREGTTGILKRKIYKSEYLDAEFEDLPKVELEVLESKIGRTLKGGIRVFNIGNRGLNGLPDGFVITHINRTAIATSEKLIDILENYTGVAYVEGFDKNGMRRSFKYYGK